MHRHQPVSHQVRLQRLAAVQQPDHQCPVQVQHQQSRAARCQRYHLRRDEAHSNPSFHLHLPFPLQASPFSFLSSFHSPTPTIPTIYELLPEPSWYLTISPFTPAPLITQNPGRGGCCPSR